MIENTALRAAAKSVSDQALVSNGVLDAVTARLECSTVDRHKNVALRALDADVEPSGATTETAFPGLSIDTGFSQIPNGFIDFVMSEISPASVVVFLYMWRNTQGRCRPKATFTAEQLCLGQASRAGRQLNTGTGMTEPTIRKAVSELASYGLITREQAENNTWVYSVRTCDRRATEDYFRAKGERNFPPSGGPQGGKKFSPGGKESFGQGERNFPHHKNVVKEPPKERSSACNAGASQEPQLELLEKIGKQTQPPSCAAPPSHRIVTSPSNYSPEDGAKLLLAAARPAPNSTQPKHRRRRKKPQSSSRPNTPTEESNSLEASKVSELLDQYGVAYETPDVRELLRLIGEHGLTPAATYQFVEDKLKEKARDGDPVRRVHLLVKAAKENDLKQWRAKYRHRSASPLPDVERPQSESVRAAMASISHADAMRWWETANLEERKRMEDWNYARKFNIVYNDEHFRVGVAAWVAYGQSEYAGRGLGA